MGLLVFFFCLGVVWAIARLAAPVKVVSLEGWAVVKAMRDEP